MNSKRHSRIKTERGFDRLVNFSDAVVAIAATLLVLPIVDVASGVTQGHVDKTIQEIVPAVLIFIPSFLIITRFWYSHHRFFEGIRSYNGRLVWYNLLWLLGIVIMPFPTQLVAKASSSDTLAVTVYLSVMLWIAFCQLLMSIELRVSPELIVSGESSDWSLVTSITLCAVVVFALIVGQFWADGGLYALFLLFLVRPISAPFVKRLSRARETT